MIEVLKPTKLVALPTLVAEKADSERQPEIGAKPYNDSPPICANKS
jgi:hypothetical protein